MIQVLLRAWDHREVLLLIGIAALFAAQVWAFSAWTIDDSYISYRYAWNLASGEGLVFNRGEWVEGYSNPLWVLLLAVPSLLGIPPDWSGKLLGFAAGLGGLAYAWWFLRHTLRASLNTTAAMLFWLATSTAWLLYTASGMETPLFGLAIVGMCAHLGARQWWPAALWCAGAAMTRPEGLLYFGPFLVVLVLDREGPLRRGHTRDLLSLLLPVAAIGGWRVFRLLAYGSSLPNTWHAKNYGRRDLWERLAHNWPGAWDTLWGGGETLLAGGLGFALVGIGVILALRRTRTWALGLVPLCLFAFLVVGGGDWMSLARFLVPGLPAAAVLMFYALGQLDRPAIPFGGVAVWGVAAAMIGVQLSQASEVVVDLPKGVHHNPAMDARGHAALGRYLATRIQPGDDDEVLLNEIGAVGYYSDGTVLDTLGLVHADVPHLHEQAMNAQTEFFLKKYPRFVALHSRRSRRKAEMYPRDASFLRWMEASGLYEQIGTFPLSSWRSYLLYERVGEEPQPGQGLLGTYGPSDREKTRVDGLIHFDWQRGAPMEGLPKDRFEVTWTGCLSLDQTRRLGMQGTERAEIRLDGQVIRPSSTQAPGSYDIEVRYRHKTGDARFTLAWSDGKRMVAVPASAMRPDRCP